MNRRAARSIRSSALLSAAVFVALSTPLHAQRRLGDGLKFVGGAAVALVAHESGHLLFDFAFNANPGIKRVKYGPFPFFAIEQRGDVTSRQEFTISSAGFWIQEAGNEYLLTRHPQMRAQASPLVKGVFAFNVLLSAGYAGSAFAKSGPDERDTRSIAYPMRLDEPVVGAMILAPALLDTYRYFRPGVRWATWTSRAVKVGSVLLIARHPR